MKVNVKVDMGKLQKTLKKMSKTYGDNHEQAVARLAVATGRQMAIETQAFGANSRKQQEGAIEVGMNVCVFAVTESRYKSLSKSKDKSQFMLVPSVAELDAELEKRRNKKGWVTVKKPTIYVKKNVFGQTLKLRKKRAGKAKGAWLGAGEKAAAKQKGNDRISIGKNFMSYAQKFSRRGNARFSGMLLSKKFCTLVNTYYHAQLKRVVSASARINAVRIATEKTLKWYKKANKANALKK